RKAARRKRQVDYFLPAVFAFRRSDQYFFMRADTAFRAAADIVRVFFCAVATTVARPLADENSGNVRSITAISWRRRARVASAPALARCFICSMLISTNPAGFLPRFGIHPPTDNNTPEFNKIKGPVCSLPRDV